MDSDRPPAGAPPKRKRLGSFVLLAVGVGAAIYLSKVGPQEQHVRIVLGDQAGNVTGVELQYTVQDGDVLRDTRFEYRAGAAPRVIAHEPELANGDYRLRIDVDTQGGRRTVQRQVSLGGGSTQVDISTALGRDPSDPHD